MTRFVVDPGAILHLVRQDRSTADGHELLAPTLLRSEVLSTLHEAVHSGEMSAATGRDLLARVGKVPIRYLGDAVLRRRAWEVAEQLGWPATFRAEYVALTQLQADHLVTVDPDFAAAVEGLVSVASVDELLGRS